MAAKGGWEHSFQITSLVTQLCNSPEGVMMPRRLLVGLVALGVTLSTGNALAQLQSRDHSTFGVGSITFDTATNLEWLDLTLTGFRSHNDMIGVDGSNEFAAGGTFAGFRYATLTEVEQLWVNAGIPQSAIFYGLDSEGHNIGTFETNNSTIFNNARALQTLLGFDLTTANPPFVNADGWRTNGMALDTSGVGFASLNTCAPGTGFCRGSSIGMTRAALEGASPFWETNLAHQWVVNEGASAAPIPEPEIYAMLGVGLGLLGWAGRRRKQDAA